jgi:hypothetical protein
MRKRNASDRFLSSNSGMIVLAAALAIAVATVGLARSSARTPNASADANDSMVLGMAFDGHQVSNLDQSIKFYELLDFRVQGKPGDWKVDKIANELGGTPGAQSRTVVMLTQSSVSDKPFPLILREYRGIDRKDWSQLDSAALGAGHMDLTVMDDCNIPMDKIKAAGMLRVPQMNLPGGGGGATGPRRFAFILDPDGWFIELFAKPTPVPGAPPQPPKVSNSSATMQNIERLGKQTGFNHIGLNVIDPVKALAFYQGVLGGDYPPVPPPGPAGAPPRMVMLNGWFPQATTGQNVRLELLLSSKQGQAAPGAALRRY